LRRSFSLGNASTRLSHVGWFGTIVSRL